MTEERKRHDDDDDYDYDDHHARRVRHQTREAVGDHTSRILVGLGVVLSSVIASFGGLEYTASTRARGFHESMDTISDENHRILQRLETLLNANLAKTAEGTMTNIQLNEKILQDAEQRKEYHLKELQKLEEIQKHLNGNNQPGDE